MSFTLGVTLEKGFIFVLPIIINIFGNIKFTENSRFIAEKDYNLAISL